MVDREARCELATCLRAFLEGSVRRDAFHDRIGAIAAETHDETVQQFVVWLWFCFDDLKNHKIVATRTDWNYFQRLLLILSTDAHVRTESTRSWHWTNGVAALLLVTFVWIAIQTGFGEHLVVIALPFGALSLLISWLVARVNNEELDDGLFPFQTRASLRSWRRRAACFAKQPYPQDLIERRIRTASMERVLHFQFYALWILLSPIALLIQTIPSSQITVEVTE